MKRNSFSGLSAVKLRLFSKTSLTFFRVHLCLIILVFFVDYSFLDPTPEFKSLMMFFMGLLTNESVSGYGRDAVIDMIIKFVPKKEGIGRALTFVTNGGQFHASH